MCIMEESKNWVDVLSAKLERIVKHNDKFSIPSSHFTIFHSSRIPSVTITSYLERIVRYSPSSTDSLILAMIYIDRVVQLAPHLRLCSHSIHRMLITSIMLASKFYDDGFYTNAYYAKVGGLLTSELNTLEVNFLFLIRFTLYVTPDAYGTYKDDLLRNRTVTPIPPSIHTPNNHQLTSNNSPSFSPLNSKLNFLSLPVPTIYPFTPFVVSPPTLTTSSSASPPLPDFSSHFPSPTDHQQSHITRTPPDRLSSFFDVSVNISNNNSNLSHPITTPVSRAIPSSDHAPFQHSHPFTPTLLPHHPPVVSCQPQPLTQNLPKQYPQFSHSNFPVYYYPSPPLYFTPSPPLIGHNFPISTHQQQQQQQQQQHQIPQTTPPLHYQFLNPSHNPNSMPSQQPIYQPPPPTQLNTANPSYQALFFPYFPLYTPQPTPTHSMSIEPNLNLKAPNFTHNVNMMPYPVYSFPNNNNTNNHNNNNNNNRECVDFQISPSFPHIPSHLFNEVHLSSTRVEIAEGFYTPFSPSINLLHEKEM